MTKLTADPTYFSLLAAIKQKVQQAQVRALMSVNREMLLLYWEVGNLILARQKEAAWGDKVLEQLSHDLKVAFPTMQGFSKTNLKYMKLLAEAYPDSLIGQAPLDQITWYHNITLLSKCPDLKQRLWYATKALEHGWSRNVMVHQIEGRLFERQGKLANNFSAALPSPDSELVQEIFKSPYLLDFLAMSSEAKEKELEEALVKHIVHFLLELGAGFAFVGRQYTLPIDDEDYRIDLLFYHLKLRRYIAFDLKTGKFMPEYAGKMNFYLSALDDLVKSDADQPSIGIILCKDKKNIVVEYALKDLSKPIGVSEYLLTNIVPAELQSNLPSVEDFERELRDIEEAD